jgi:protein tyrosine phosphatase (PTP) superfamily phosphohydrolase (DUF442 family)
VKGWNKKRYDDIFMNPAHEHDRNGYRVYLPLESASSEAVAPNPIVVRALASKKYKISDYKAGIASDESGRRQMRIGKILADDPSAKQAFDNDPARAATQAQYEVVISRHPYDIAGMSTDRGWTSCMNLNTGQYKKYLAIDVKQGTVVAYVVKLGDRNINRPVGRIAIKPFVNIKDKSEIAFGIEDIVYGADVPGFGETVLTWVDEVNDARKLNGVFELDPDLYSEEDGSGKTRFVGQQSEEYLKNSVRGNGLLIQHIKTPSKEVQHLAVQQNGLAIKYIKSPSDEIQRIAIKQNEHAIGYIDSPSEDVQKLAVQYDGNVIQYLKNASEAVKKLAVQQNGLAIRYITNPSEDVQKLAVQHTKTAIKLIKNPSEEVQKLAQAVQ